MKKQTFSLLAGAVLAVALLLVSCHSSYEVTKVEGGRIPMNSVWDAEPDAEAVALLAPYKARMDTLCIMWWEPQKCRWTDSGPKAFYPI